MGDFVSRSEVKNILRIADGYVENESVTMSSMSPKKLANKGNVNIIYVAADANNSTEGTTYYTTSADYKTTSDPTGAILVKKKTTTSTIGDTQTIYVRYTYNQYDTLIDDLIPQVKADILQYLNNTFPDNQTQYSGNFQILSSGKIRDTEQQFKLEGFEDGMDFILSGSARNGGVYTASSVTSEYITVDSKSSLLNEKSTDFYGGRIINITRVNYPVGLKIPVAKIIWANIDKIRSDNVKSKSIGPLSLTYESISNGGYDQNIYKLLQKYKYTKMS
jgi:hypothetical protein